MRPPPSSISAADESSLQTLVLNIATQLRKDRKIFFHKVTSRSMITEVIPGPFSYALEFPFPFVQENGELFKSQNVTFERKNSDRRWPIKITVRKFKHSRNRVFAYGKGGWKDFLMDSRIQVGDVVFFIWLGMSRYQVVHVASGKAGPLKSVVDGAVSSAKRPDPSVVQASSCCSPSTCRVCGGILALDPPHLFLVTVRASHAPGNGEAQKSLSLEVPGWFWECHHGMLRGDELSLQGPRYKPVVMVKAVRTYHLEDEPEECKLIVHLERGWKAFFHANRLQLGDTLWFTLVEPQCFKVDLLIFPVSN